jgi:hypothetical protein
LVQIIKVLEKHYVVNFQGSIYTEVVLALFTLDGIFSMESEANQKVVNKRKIHILAWICLKMAKKKVKNFM